MLTSKRAILAQTAALAAIAVSAPAVAQEQSSAGEEQVSEGEGNAIVVTGFRRSLQDSINLKRNSSAVVDAISAEDVGKFPDQNVAEALQRITGVAIDRAGGEGQSITVRGLGPEFNAVLSRLPKRARQTARACLPTVVHLSELTKHSQEMRKHRKCRRPELGRSL